MRRILFIKSRGPVGALMLGLWLAAGCEFTPPPYTTPVGAQDQGMDQRAELDLSERQDMQVVDPQDMMSLVDMREDQGQRDMQAHDQGQDMTLDQGDDMAPVMQSCGDQLVDLSSDPSHCGQCDNACDPSFGVCSNGVCGCQGGMEACGAQRTCREVRNDPNHCGQCDFKCGDGAACNQGQCQCRPGFTSCGGECVDTRVDPRHCGQCGQSCGDKACRNSSCRDNDRCDFGDIWCDVGQGKACLKPDTQDNDLYCRSAVDLSCGDRCKADESCVKLDLLKPRECVRYRPARGCLSCPCADCGDGEVCLEETIGAARRAYCFKD